MTRIQGHRLFTYMDTLTPSGGEVAADIIQGTNLIKFNNEVKQIIVKATSSTTTFDFGVYDKTDDFPLWTKTGNIGYFNDAARLLLCLEGMAYLKIANASVDEAMDVRLIYR